MPKHMVNADLHRLFTLNIKRSVSSIPDGPLNLCYGIFFTIQ